MDDDEYQKMKESWEAKLRTGQPIHVVMSLIYRLNSSEKQKERARLIVLACAIHGDFEPAAVVRVR